MRDSILKLGTLFACIIFMSGCQNNDVEKHQSRNNIEKKISNRITQIKVDSISDCGSYVPQIVGKYLVVISHQTDNKFVHIFNKNNFEYITSCMRKGHGKDEYVKIDSEVIPIGTSNEFYILADNLKLFRANVDSIIESEEYAPVKAFDWGKKAKLFPNDCHLIDANTAITSVIEPTGNSGYEMTFGRINLDNCEIKKFSYTHPKATHKRFASICSVEHNVCGQVFRNRDLIILYDLDGKHKCNIYGPDWSNKDETNGIYYFSDAIIAKDKILATYSGKNYGSGVIYTDKIIVFDIEGNYLKTLDLEGNSISRICYDSDNDRIIFTGDEYELAYLPLNGLL